MPEPSPLPPDRLEQRFEDYKPLYTEGEAIAEANRCLYCVDAPCIQGCPTAIDIPAFIRKIATGNRKGAARSILSANVLGYSCARVCPVEVLCAGACVYNAWGRPPIQIGRLQRFATESILRDHVPLFSPKPPTGRKVALVGAGPASLAAAALLALEGHASTIFERKSVPGGLNSLGIAPYKFQVDDALFEVEWVRSLGVEIRTGTAVGSDPGSLSPARLLAAFDAVFLGLGLGADSSLGIPGEEGPGVLGAVDLIERIKSDAAFRLNGVAQALVVGGGNTAIDAAHELRLLGIPFVAMVYRRSESEMKGYGHEMDHARRDGVVLLENRVPLAILRAPDGRVRSLRVAVAKDGSPVPGSDERIPADLIAVAIGQSRATDMARAFPGVELDPKGRIVVDPATHRTGNPKVWSGGDCVNGGKEVVNAVAESKTAVRDMLRALDALPRASTGPSNPA
ncbi:MAG TPA: FAD-dependent oxidoreductase [Planctomycetota bacterium]|nr:FAD-dependent oxidoreductase [Planctomycetota bacterium]